MISRGFYNSSRTNLSLVRYRQFPGLDIYQLYHRGWAHMLPRLGFAAWRSNSSSQPHDMRSSHFWPPPHDQVPGIAAKRNNFRVMSGSTIHHSLCVILEAGATRRTPREVELNTPVRLENYRPLALGESNTGQNSVLPGNRKVGGRMAKPQYNS